MAESIEIGPMRPEEAGAVSAVAIEVFNRVIAPKYGERGRRVFLVFASPARIKAGLKSGNVFYVARQGRRIVGLIEIRGNRHIAMLFVDKAYQRMGIGRSLVERAKSHVGRKSGAGRKMTVNAAPGAVCIYERLGFRRAGKPQENDGILFTPMVCRIS